MSKSTVSIITPTYNHERYIGACIESVLTQSYPHWEMIIVDDGSTDGTWKIVQSYAARDRRIKAFRQANKGIWRLAESYNFALAQSRGALVAILEGDDVWLPRKLEMQVPIHCSRGYALSFGQAINIDASGRHIHSRPFPTFQTHPFLRESPDELVRRLAYGEYFVYALTAMISREYLDLIAGFQQPDYLPVIDYPTWLEIGIRGGSFGFIPDVLGYYRISGGQASWLLARSIARGAYRLVQELVASSRLTVEGGPDHVHAKLMSANRRRFLADSSYRAAAIAFEHGRYQEAWYYSAEIPLYGHFRMFLKCLAMFGWKAIRKAYSKPDRQSYT